MKIWCLWKVSDGGAYEHSANSEYFISKELALQSLNLHRKRYKEHPEFKFEFRRDEEDSFSCHLPGDSWYYSFYITEETVKDSI